MNQHDTPGLAVEGVDKRIGPGLQILQLIFQKIQSRKKVEAERKEEEATGELAQQGAMPILDIQGFHYVAFDGDGIGNKIAQAEEMDDEAGLRQQSAAIEAGQKVAWAWAKKYGGKLIEDGGDQGIVKVPTIALDAVEDLRADYLKASGATLTVGIGDSISESTKARMLGKLRGKNQAVTFNEDTKKELKIRKEAEPSPDANKKLIAAGLGAPPNAPGTNPDQEQQDPDLAEPAENEDSDAFPIVEKK